MSSACFTPSGNPPCSIATIPLPPFLANLTTAWPMMKTALWNIAKCNTFVDNHLIRLFARKNSLNCFKSYVSLLLISVDDRMKCTAGVACPLFTGPVVHAHLIIFITVVLLGNHCCVVRLGKVYNQTNFSGLTQSQIKSICVKCFAHWSCYMHYYALFKIAGKVCGLLATYSSLMWLCCSAFQLAVSGCTQSLSRNVSQWNLRKYSALTDAWTVLRVACATQCFSSVRLLWYVLSFFDNVV